MLDRLRGDPAYVDAFFAAFPDDPDPFTLDRVARAYAAFVATMISGRSAYDRATHPVDPDPGAISESAWRGQALSNSHTRASTANTGFKVTERSIDGVAW